MMWASLGLVLSALVAVAAAWRSARRSTNYYEVDVYGMTPASHRKYAAVSLVFAAVFVAALFTPLVPAVPLLAVYAVIAIFYLSSFVRGFSDEE
jgi:hypothetical protein